MISVVIPSYNRCESMITLLNDLRKQRGVEFEVIVVDDKSPDDSYTRLKEAFPDVDVTINEKNGGPCVTRNAGIKRAKYDIIVGFDSDVSIPDPDCLAKILAEFEKYPDVAALAIRLKQPNEVDEDFARWWHPHPIEKTVETPFLTPYFSGTGYAFKKEPLLKAGAFPEILYMAYEENELAYRFLNLGEKILYTPIPWVVHHENQVARRSEVREFYRHRNQILMSVQCFSLGKSLAFVLPRTVYAFLDGLRNKSLGSYFKSLKSAYALAKIRRKTRDPLTRETWAYIDHISKNVVTPESS
ncbi:glycosyltransferase family 2 protein [Pelagicoccus albus]|uniref:Glycosyltransferase family 2 protein n=1 Tax=Pelagicoccus albus TaxID=415222 RepID=A0A7X1EAC0_9BACT|nr:glycosyltransferase family 2 protein [Pelagicoccus albus]MBC2608241.1 glycosyltransferase family 2 protein [Pelagicoccus albus]